MGKFQSRSLEVLDRLYDFVGGTRRMDTFDLAGSVQPVHDMSREAELGSRGVRQGGFIYIGDTLTNATMGVTTIFTSRDIYASLDSVGVLQDFSSRLHRLWLMDVFGSVDDTGVTNFTEAGAAIKYQDPAVRLQFLRHWDGVTASVASGEDHPMVQIEASLPFQRTRPLYLPFGGTPTLLQANAISSDDCTARVHWLLWAGPIGTTPPGMR